MFKIKELLQLLTNNLKDFIDTVLKDPKGYLLYKLIPSLILTKTLPKTLTFILSYYLQNIVSEQIIWLFVKILNKILKRIILTVIFNIKIKIIWEVVVYKLFNYIKMILMDNITLNKNKINNM